MSCFVKTTRYHIMKEVGREGQGSGLACCLTWSKSSHKLNSAHYHE